MSYSVSNILGYGDQERHSGITDNFNITSDLNTAISDLTINNSSVSDSVVSDATVSDSVVSYSIVS